MENLLGTDLPDDLGEWIMDGVILCQVVNRLHPGTISIIHSPPPGQVSKCCLLCNAPSKYSNGNSE